MCDAFFEEQMSNSLFLDACISNFSFLEQQVTIANVSMFDYQTASMNYKQVHIPADCC